MSSEELHQITKKVLFTRGIHHKMEMPQNTVSAMRRRFKEGKMTRAKKLEILFTAGRIKVADTDT